jgi:hypothetical protein
VSGKVGVKTNRYDLATLIQEVKYERAGNPGQLINKNQ